MIHDYDKILTRLTIILQRLYEGEVLSVGELAEEFGVSTKTIQRDFNQRLIRFPIQKQGGKWKMQSGFSLTKERTPEEVLVLEMLCNIAEGIGSEFGVKAKTLFSKLQNSTSNPIYSKTIIEDISDQLEHFRIIEEAILLSKMVRFQYANKLRSVRPYRIVSFEGYWYLYGEELADAKLKTYYFKDIHHLESLDELFLPDDAKCKILERAINSWFEPNKEPFCVTLKASAAIAKYFQRRPLAATQQIVKTYDDGSLEIEVFATSEREILQEIKKWMPDLAVVSPASLVLKAKDIANGFLMQQDGVLVK